MTAPLSACRSWRPAQPGSGDDGALERRRLPRIVWTLVATAALAVAAGLLAGCAGPSVTRAPAVGLLRTAWHVRDAAGAGRTAWLLFVDGGLRVQLAGGTLLDSWATQGDRMLIAPYGTPPASRPDAGTVNDWLARVASFGRSGSDWLLLDAQGGVLAALR